MAAIPADGTWFDTINKSFADVPIGAEDGISTTEFLEAAESLVTLFGASYSSPAYICLKLTHNPSRCPRFCRFHPGQE
jgi:hypothetical protein